MIVLKLVTIAKQANVKALVAAHFAGNALAHTALVAFGVSVKLSLILELREDFGDVASAVALRRVNATLAVAVADNALLRLPVR